MVRRYILALAVLGVFFVVAAGSSQAGWGHHSESSHPGESMSTEPATPEETTGAYEDPKKSGMESSEYQTDEPAETGRLPEEERFENNVIFGDDVERQLREGIVTGGP